MTPTDAWLTAATPWPAARARFHLTHVHTADDAPAAFVGTWITPGRPHNDGPQCGVYIDLVRRDNGTVAAALTADREDVQGTRVVAAWEVLSPHDWPQAIAPAAAAHPWLAHTHHWVEEKPLFNRWQRAALAWLIVH